MLKSTHSYRTQGVQCSFSVRKIVPVGMLVAVETRCGQQRRKHSRGLDPAQFLNATMETIRDVHSGVIYVEKLVTSGLASNWQQMSTNRGCGVTKYHNQRRVGPHISRHPHHQHQPAQGDARQISAGVSKYSR